MTGFTNQVDLTWLVRDMSESKMKPKCLADVLTGIDGIAERNRSDIGKFFPPLWRTNQKQFSFRWIQQEFVVMCPRNNATEGWRTNIWKIDEDQPVLTFCMILHGTTLNYITLHHTSSRRIYTTMKESYTNNTLQYISIHYILTLTDFALSVEPIGVLCF